MLKLNKLVGAASVLLLLASCTKNEPVAPETKKETGHNEATKKTIIVDGSPMYSGYGYDPDKDRAYRNAIDPWSTFESTDIKDALTVEVEAIETKEQLERFVGRNYSVSSGFNIGIFSLGMSIVDNLQRKITIDANHVSVVARIKSRSHKYICDRYPFLTEYADRVAKRNDVTRFAGNYGLMYVDTRIVGGEVYYIYNYDYRSVNQWSKSYFKAKVTASIAMTFGISASTGVSQEEKNLIGSAQKKSGITSTTPGFAPRVITEVGQINREIQELQNYLNAHPEKATTIEMKLRPYHHFLKYDYPDFAKVMEAEYNKYIASKQ